MTTYFASCDCGREFAIELHQAGSQQPCPSCARAVAIPSLSKLKQLAGDKNPLLGPLQKVIHALATHEAPFDGVCHGCGQSPAQMQIPIGLQILEERILDHDGRIVPTLHGFKLVAAAGEEKWTELVFPLLLCDQCYGRFESEFRRSSWLDRSKTIFYLSLICGFIYVGFTSPEYVVPFVSLFSIVGAIAWMARFRQQRVQIGANLRSWLDRIQWVSEVLTTEDEYRVVASRAVPLPKSSDQNVTT